MRHENAWITFKHVCLWGRLTSTRSLSRDKRIQSEQDLSLWEFCEILVVLISSGSAVKSKMSRKCAGPRKAKTFVEWRMKVESKTRARVGTLVNFRQLSSPLDNSRHLSSIFVTSCQLSSPLANSRQLSPTALVTSRQHSLTLVTSRQFSSPLVNSRHLSLPLVNSCQLLSTLVISCHMLVNFRQLSSSLVNFRHLSSTLVSFVVSKTCNGSCAGYKIMWSIEFALNDLLNDKEKFKGKRTNTSFRVSETIPSVQPEN